MGRRHLAFDIETAKEVPGEDFNWRPHRPLGIACAATLASDSSEVRLWYGKTKDGAPSSQMTRADAKSLVQYLVKMAGDGYTILTWNGLGFDFDVLAEESGAAASCKQCALEHVDMMFHIVCSLGYPVSLESAARGMGLAGKPAGMSGIQAPALWAQGRHQEVLEYVAQDVRTAIEIARAAEKRRRFEWITRKGTKKTMPLQSGWLTVNEALQLPEPDTSWMTRPLKRQHFMDWMTTA
ncbi:MAG: ribonuclease H-like domain-containing protein [Isosphaeraceae bacterium]